MIKQGHQSHTYKGRKMTEQGHQSYTYKRRRMAEQGHRLHTYKGRKMTGQARPSIIHLRKAENGREDSGQTFSSSSFIRPCIILLLIIFTPLSTRIDVSATARAPRSKHPAPLLRRVSNHGPVRNALPISSPTQKTLRYLLQGLSNSLHDTAGLKY